MGWAQTATQFIFDPLGLYQPTSGEKAAMAGNGGTPSSTNKFVTEEGAYKVLKFGGSGVDGALAISSGTTTIDLGGARIFERNYTSISITGTGALAFTNPNTKGTVITLKSQGDVIITSTATNAISTIGMGAAGGLYGQSGGINPANQGRAGEIPHSLFFATDNPSALQNAVAGTQVVSDFYTYTKEQLNKKTIFLIPGGGGGGANGGSGANQNNAGSGGNGGGSLYIECAGAWNFTGQINTSGASGTNAQAPAAGVAGLSGGGGGSAGMLLVLYNTLTTNSGTVVALGGSGGNGASATGNSLATDSSGAGAGSFGAVGAASVNSSGANGNNSTLGAGASGGCGFDGTGSGGTGGVCTSSMSTLILKNYYF